MDAVEATNACSVATLRTGQIHCKGHIPGQPTAEEIEAQRKWREGELEGASTQALATAGGDVRVEMIPQWTHIDSVMFYLCLTRMEQTAFFLELVLMREEEDNIYTGSKR
jgi:hypothetical protein